jgi:hypothetical protein
LFDSLVVASLLLCAYCYVDVDFCRPTHSIESIHPSIIEAALTLKTDSRVGLSVVARVVRLLGVWPLSGEPTNELPRRRQLLSSIIVPPPCHVNSTLQLSSHCSRSPRFKMFVTLFLMTEEKELNHPSIHHSITQSLKHESGDQHLCGNRLV